MNQAQHNIRRQQQHPKRRYDLNRPKIQLRIGQAVSIVRPEMHSIFKELYGESYEIIEQLAPATYDHIH